MPFDPVAVALEVAGGLAAVCATCERHWAAKARQLPRCLATSGCCSPLGGGTFHEYRGPLTPEAFKLFCFVCGDKSTRAIRVGQNPKLIGVCQQHIQLFQRLAPVGKEPPRVTDLTTAVDNQPLVQPLPPPRKSLFTAIAETEAEFAAEDQTGK
jgi:hypothetical protein